MAKRHDGLKGTEKELNPFASEQKSYGTQKLADAQPRSEPKKIDLVDIKLLNVFLQNQNLTPPRSTPNFYDEVETIPNCSRKFYAFIQQARAGTLHPSHIPTREELITFEKTCATFKRENELNSFELDVFNALMSKLSDLTGTPKSSTQTAPKIAKR